MVAGLLLLAPAAASAQVQVIPLGQNTHLGAGPRLAGEEVVWAERTSRDTIVMAEGPAGRRELFRESAYEADDSANGAARKVSMDADEQAVAIASWNFFCEDEACDRYEGERPERFAFHSGPLAGPLSRFETRCAFRAEVGGGAVGGDCFSDFQVREADGAVHTYETDQTLVSQYWPVVPRVPHGRLAGDLVALRRSGGITVLRRASGEELLRVDARVRSFDVGPDGTVAYVLQNGRPGWSSPADPTMHELPGGPATDLVLAGDSVALRYSEGRFARFQIVRLDGRFGASHDTNAAVGDFDYDGRHVVYARRPCAHSELRVWDSEGPPGPHVLLVAGCMAPRVVADRRVRNDRRVRMTLRCEPRSGKAGCFALMNLTFRWRDRRGRVRRRPLNPTRYVAIELGEEEAFALRLRRRDLRRARSGELVVSLRAEETPEERVRVRLRLPRRR